MFISYPQLESILVSMDLLYLQKHEGLSDLVPVAEGLDSHSSVSETAWTDPRPVKDEKRSPSSSVGSASILQRLHQKKKHLNAV